MYSHVMSQVQETHWQLSGGKVFSYGGSLGWERTQVYSPVFPVFTLSITTTMFVHNMGCSKPKCIVVSADLDPNVLNTWVKKSLHVNMAMNLDFFS